MSKQRALILSLVLGFAVYLFIVLKTQASDFTQVYLRLDSQKASAALSGTLCAKPSSAGAGTEAKVTVLFPNSFSLSSTLSNWTTDTNANNLPAGTSAWTGISANATAINGNVVIFTSGDLTNGSTLYCFHFTASSSNTGTAGNDKTGTITTKNSSNVIIDTDDYGTSILSNNTISVTASVPANPTDFQADLTKTSPAGTTFSQNTTIVYQITYGSYLTSASSFTVEAQWYQGTISGNPTPTVDVVDYVTGSAGNAYNSTPPVIDTVNKKITWTISSFPASTQNETVSFSLKTTSSYTGSSTVTFPVAARITGTGTTTADSTVTLTYQYNYGITSTPIPTQSTGGPGDGRSDGKSDGRSDGKSSAPGTTPAQIFSFKDITMQTISPTDATIAISTNKKSSVSLNYGTSIKNLNKKLTSLTSVQDHEIKLENLTPDTIYYFQVSATDASGKTIYSDFYIFRTAVVSEAPQIERNTIIITSEKNIIYNPTVNIKELNRQALAVIPKGFLYQFHFSLNKSQLVKNVKARIKNANVLGLSTFTIDKIDANSNDTTLIETQPGVFAGQLMSDLAPGKYELIVTISDYKGNISEEKLSEVKISNPFTVLEKITKSPIENAKVLFSLYNERTRTYEIISPQILPIINPTFSEPDGIVSTVFPQGKYRAEISNIGYKSRTVEFTIGPNADEDYPTVILEKEPFSIITMFKYYFQTGADFFNSIKSFTQNLSESFRFFDLVAFITISILVVLTFISFNYRTHIPLLSLLWYLFYHVHLFVKKSVPQSYITGFITDKEKKKPIVNAEVFLIDYASGQILAKTRSNNLGSFLFRNTKYNSYKIKVLKEGYESDFSYDYIKKSGKSEKITLELEARENLGEVLVKDLEWTLRSFISFSFETLLVASFLFEILLGYSLGWGKALPLLLISGLNLLVWILHLRNAENWGN